MKKQGSDVTILFHDGGAAAEGINSGQTSEDVMTYSSVPSVVEKKKRVYSPAAHLSNHEKCFSSF